MAKKYSASMPMIIISFIIGLTLTIIPIPNSLENYRPEWVMLILIYWSIYAPKKVGPGVGFLVGLLLDVLVVVLLGEYALIGTLTAFICNQLHKRLQLFPLLQQTAFVFLLLGLQFLMILWIQGLSGHPLLGWELAIPVFVSTALWPVIYFVLEWLRHFR